MEEDSQNCAFTLQTDLNKANMSQKIDLRSIWNRSIWKMSTVELTVRLTAGVFIDLHGLGHHGNILRRGVLRK